MLLSATNQKIDLNSEILTEKAATALHMFGLIAKDLDKAVSEQAEGLRMLLRKRVTAPIISLSPDFDVSASKDQVARQTILAHTVKLVIEKLVRVLDTQDSVTAANAINGDMIANIVETGQPADFVLMTYDKFGKTFVGTPSQSAYDRQRHGEIAEQYVRDLIAFSAMGAPTTLAKAGANGATLQELRLMQDELGTIRTMLDDLMVKTFIGVRESNAPAARA